MALKRIPYLNNVLPQHLHREFWMAAEGHADPRGRQRQD